MVGALTEKENMIERLALALAGMTEQQKADMWYYLVTCQRFALPAPPPSAEVTQGLLH